MGLNSAAHWVRVPGEQLYQYWNDKDIWYGSIISLNKIVAYIVEEVSGIESDGRCIWNNNAETRYPILMAIYNNGEEKYDDETIRVFAEREWGNYIGYCRDNPDSIKMNYYRVEEK